jgi:SOS-response transcriptional repressor LexA
VRDDQEVPRGRGDEVDEERARDRLVQLAKGRALDALAPDDPANAPFFEWLARDARDRQTAAERAATEAAADRFAERLFARVAAARCAVMTIDAAPEEAADITQEMPELLPSVLGPMGRPRRVPAFDLAVAAGIGRDLWDEPCERWIALPEGTGNGRFVALTVAGDSMLPLLHAGDVILVRLGGEIAADTIVVARHPDDGYVVKRVGRVGRAEVELVSLNSAYGPVVIPHDESLVLGTVVLRWCSHQQRAPRAHRASPAA